MCLLVASKPADFATNGQYSRGTDLTIRAKTQIFCTREEYGWTFVYSA